MLHCFFWVEDSYRLYETEACLYLVYSNERRNEHRVMKIARHPMPTSVQSDAEDATVEVETWEDRKWRLDIFEDPHVYSPIELNRLLATLQAANESDDTGGSLRMTKLHAHGVLGFIRFLRGFYMILITKRVPVAELGEHIIYKIEDTHMVYIPTPSRASPARRPETATESQAPSRTSLVLSSLLGGLLSKQQQREQRGESSESADSAARAEGSVFDPAQTTLSNEVRYLRLFQSVDLSSNFYFSYTYDLTRSLQYNVAPSLFRGADATREGQPRPEDRFAWNWFCVPPRFRNEFGNGRSPWFITLIHGYVGQASIQMNSFPLCLTLIARRSRRFAGARFLKRGANFMGDVANEVETEQIVHHTVMSRLNYTLCSSYVQLRGSVPLFWSQEPMKRRIGKPPIELLKRDPCYEAMGRHFRDLISRFGSPLIVINLMKQKEKNGFEQLLSTEFLAGIEYLNNLIPSTTTRSCALRSWSGEEREANAAAAAAGAEDIGAPIVYLAFDMARVQRSKRLNVLDKLNPIAEVAVRQTGIFFSPGLSPAGPSERLFSRARRILEERISPIQCGVVRVNCVDCLDRTNTCQFVVGRVALGFQLHALGFLPHTDVRLETSIDRLLQDLYEEMGDTIALQYGGSCLVHNIETYRKTGKFRSQSRDLVQTLSRYYSNKFSDHEKQMALDVFLGVFRPGAGGTPRDQLTDPRLQAVCAASRATGELWDAPSDSFYHWLEAHARHSLSRAPLTDWCPLAVLRCLPVAERLFERLRLLEKAALRPKAGADDWFERMYPPQEYVSFSQLVTKQMHTLQLTSAVRSSFPLDERSTSGLLNLRHLSGMRSSLAEFTPLQSRSPSLVSMAQEAETPNSSDSESISSTDSFLFVEPDTFMQSANPAPHDRLDDGDSLLPFTLRQRLSNWPRRRSIADLSHSACEIDSYMRNGCMNGINSDSADHESAFGVAEYKLSPEDLQILQASVEIGKTFRVKIDESCMAVYRETAQQHWNLRVLY